MCLLMAAITIVGLGRLTSATECTITSGTTCTCPLPTFPAGTIGKQNVDLTCASAVSPPVGFFLYRNPVISIFSPMFIEVTGVALSVAASVTIETGLYNLCTEVNAACPSNIAFAKITQGTYTKTVEVAKRDI